VRLGIFDHFGWAIAVVADDDHDVVDRRRIELVEPGLTQAPVHYDAAGLDDAALAALIDRVRASVVEVGGAALDALPGPIASMSLRTWPADFPTDLATIRRSPWEARADAVMYRQALAELAEARGWAVHTYDAKSVEAQAAALLGSRAEDLLVGPKARLGAPWAKDHRTALAATVLAAPT
jgi:hypothetical protein